MELRGNATANRGWFRSAVRGADHEQNVTRINAASSGWWLSQINGYNLIDNRGFTTVTDRFDTRSP
jgi:hypothetical protein